MMTTMAFERCMNVTDPSFHLLIDTLSYSLKGERGAPGLKGTSAPVLKPSEHQIYLTKTDFDDHTHKNDTPFSGDSGPVGQKGEAGSPRF